jgi:hypothetical protein
MVECYAGYKADERPMRFSFVSPEAGNEDLGSGSPEFKPALRSYEVTDVLDRWCGPGYDCFKIRADDRNLYILRHQLGDDTWELDAFRADHGV